MNAAETLRAAATKLRALATAASTDADGRPTTTWTAVPRGPRDSRLTADHGTPLLHGGSTGPHGRGVRPHLHPQHAAYIAAMHPGVGTALADWLADAADRWDQIQQRWEGQHALTIASALLGEVTG